MVTIGTIKIPAKRISEEAMKPVITRECVCVCVCMSGGWGSRLKSPLFVLSCYQQSLDR